MVVKSQLNNISCQHQYGRKYGHTLHTFLAHILRDTPKPKILIEIHVGGGGWVKFKVNLQIWSRTNIFTVKRTHLFVNCINILPLQLFALTSPCSCKRNPTIARNATYLSFHLYILHHTCLYIVGASLVRFPGPHYIVSRGTWIGQAMQCRHHHHIYYENQASHTYSTRAGTVGLWLVMQTMILIMVYLNWWDGCVQWRLHGILSHHDEVQIRRQVDKIYFLWLLWVFLFQKSIFLTNLMSNISWNNIFAFDQHAHGKKVKVSNIQRSLHFHHHLATRRHYLYKLEIQPPSDTTCNCWKIGHQVAPHAFVENLANLNYLKIWPPGGTICKSWKFGDQVVPLVLVLNLATKWRHLYYL